MNPIREELRTSRVKRKQLNAEWWKLNNVLTKIEAEIGRIAEGRERLPKLETQQSEILAKQAALHAKIAEQDTWQENLKAKLRASAVLAQQFKDDV